MGLHRRPGQRLATDGPQVLYAGAAGRRRLAVGRWRAELAAGRPARRDFDRLSSGPPVDAAEAWFAGSRDRFATCPFTQGSLLRLLLREGQAADTAGAVVSAVVGSPRHEFWPDDASYQDVPMRGVVGHRQVTDAYLAHLARAHQGRLATFDQGLAELHDDVVDLVPVDRSRGSSRQPPDRFG